VWVRVPVGVSADRLLGGLDLEGTLATGKAKAVGGLLAAADGGFLVIEHVNLLDAGSAASIAGALDSGIVRVEREGVSAESRARISVVATFDPAEGEVSPALGDRLGMHVSGASTLTPEARVRLLMLLDGFDSNPLSVIAEHGPETDRLRSAIQKAHRRLRSVALAEKHRRLLCETGLSLGVEGHCGEIFAARTARASAALEGRRKVDERDLETAVRLCLLPRAHSAPASAERPRGEPHGEASERAGGESGEELVLAETDSGLDRSLLNQVPPLASITAGARRRGGRDETAPATRGREVGATDGAGKSRNVAIDATLRAAAPFQIRRGGGPGQRIRIEAGDLRHKRFEQAPGVLVIFVVDASGSMALNRIGQAKGAAMRLLGEAYLHRDKVALIVFRGAGAELVVPPTRSPELAQRRLSALPAGGGTPLAEGLEAALELALRGQRTGLGRPLVVVLTDGRPNIARRPDCGIWPDLEDVCAEFTVRRISCVVIDSRNPFLSGGEAARVAGLLGARYVLLPQADADSVYRAVTAMR
jgi:magnesium chelatase subunit D